MIDSALFFTISFCNQKLVQPCQVEKELKIKLEDRSALEKRNRER